MKIFCLKDNVVGKFINPYLMHNEAQARRELKIAVNENKELKNKAGDIQLYKLGEFNEETGEIKSEVEYIETAINLVERSLE